MTLQPCGTPAAYTRHIRRGDEPCAACRAAHTEAVRQRRKTVPGALVRNAKTGAARARALTRLKAMHPGQYRALYTEEMGR